MRYVNYIKWINIVKWMAQFHKKIKMFWFLPKSENNNKNTAFCKSLAYMIGGVSCVAFIIVK